MKERIEEELKLIEQYLRIYKNFLSPKEMIDVQGMIDRLKTKLSEYKD